ncbi:uncharacterized protein SPPG_02325 [Spizellomyces punctatus DAOM BR117]|uniref:Glycosyltransferase 61 catalytic domain-containing protein n=1 Tax=Spizellomyces punctatus (strain DAOM BR117) TaxID=645134 RepID=A0A0L0HR05_SPIPD|nr:uncharacterized protein SPPG_02325 [Spizellomyces punctatus DAOM BR117]KND03274.1 hypothetical protein SPPG_02325 [Spizellomyces punctatus DAOM BR117]|eukprot:XP_016611313.1 hypothetical protein SPPG_02325 [Spizellomyces punctatus DAOM BR117]
MSGAFRRRGNRFDGRDSPLPQSRTTTTRKGRSYKWSFSLFVLGLGTLILAWKALFKLDAVAGPPESVPVERETARAEVLVAEVQPLSSPTITNLPSTALQKVQKVSHATNDAVETATVTNRLPTNKKFEKDNPVSTTVVYTTPSVDHAQKQVAHANATELNQKAELDDKRSQQQGDMVNQARLSSNVNQTLSEDDRKWLESQVEYELDDDAAQQARLEENKKNAEKKKKLAHVNKKDNTAAYIFPTLPSSSVWCYGEDRASRICRFRNLCYLPSEKQWFITQTNRTIQSNVPLHRFADGLLELSTVEGHTLFRFNFVEVSPYNPRFRNLPVRYEEKLHFMFSRLHPNNIMHNLHDDVLGMYFVLKEFVGRGSQRLGMPFSLDTHRVLIYDGYGASQATRPFQYLSSKPLRFRAYLDQDEDIVTCFRDIVLGNSKQTTWYQYGFEEPQGPIRNKTPNGMLIREVSEWFTRRMGLSLGEDEQYDKDSGKSEATANNAPAEPVASVDFPETDLIVIMGRRSNRLILNERQLKSALAAAFNLKVQVVTNEKHSFEEQVAFMRRARVVVGMHGSILVMAMFCRRGTVLLEMFPFGVPSENYTPYRTMADLPGMALVYRAWEASVESECVPHPENHPLLGGIEHLPSDKQVLVREMKRVPKHICCDNPFWLYRIYQDTRVNITEVISLIESGLQESRGLLSTVRVTNWEETELLPPPVKGIECLDGPTRDPGELWVKWALPWTGAAVDQWNVLISVPDDEQRGSEHWVPGDKPALSVKGFKAGQRLRVFIRPVVGSFTGEWSKGRCIV